MKSLEIVNRNIKAIKKLLYNLKDVQEGTKEDFDKYYHEQELKEQKQIKQDLEVLEIIRKKDVNLATLKLCIMRTDTIEQLLSKYNKSRYFTQDELTMEELLKLKQWLEVNENE